LSFVVGYVTIRVGLGFLVTLHPKPKAKFLFLFKDKLGENRGIYRALDWLSDDCGWSFM